MTPSKVLPPTSQTRDLKLSRVMGHAHIDKPFVAVDVIGAVGNRRTYPQVGIVVDVNFFGLALRSPRPAAILESADPLFLFGINRKNRFASAQKLFDLLVDVAKLFVPAFGRFSFDGLCV